jgi:protein-disulfide isomerase
VTKKQLLILLAAFVLIAGGLGVWLAMGDSSTDAGVTGASGTNPGYVLLPTDKALGNPKSKVVMIEYGAPSCPVCAAFNANTFDQFKKAYVDTGKVYYVFRVFNLRPDDAAAEKIARCLPEDKYFSFIDLLFRNQPLWDVEFGVTDVHGGLVRLGRMAGLGADQVDKCIENKTEDDRINKVQTEAESRYSINSTPTFIVNGNTIGTGALTFEQLSQSLDAELAKKQ